MKTCVRAKVSGRVQGVGFRPTVFRYATQFGLCGYVCNTPQGVVIEVEGEELIVGAFFHQLASAPPQQAQIADFQKEICDSKGYQRFEVVESEPDGDLAVHIAPDLATCDECVQELFDAKNRRNGHAFINCTNCGPRFSIIRDLPYDRARTSMSKFTMCEPCDHEYHNPRDRRFHAQPNACQRCGPQLRLRVVGGMTHLDVNLSKTTGLLHRGRIVAIKGIGGYHLVCDATNPDAVARLRSRKHRAHKPLAVMFRDLRTLRRFCRVNEAEEAELLSVARPIVLVSRRPNARPLAREISPDTETVGAFLPYTPVQHLLFEEFDALVMTSANLTDEPIISDESDLPHVMGSIADAALTHDRPIVHKCDDSVVRIVNGQRQFIRRARGFVPNPIRIAEDSPQVLAVGGELKSTFCLVRGGNAFLSQYVGDLKDYRTYSQFLSEIESWKKLMRIEPAVVAHDLHPGYLSTQFAARTVAFHRVGVQHHHAHIAGVMAEHGLHEPVIGVALDGTGYGTDDTIWGGEFLVTDRCDFERVAHFKTYRLPGGEKAIEEPWRMAASVLADEGLAEVARARFPRFKLGLVQKMARAGFNSPPTSSAGRLFDAVAAYLGLCDMASYEGQAAVRLESIADPRVREQYPFLVETRERPWVLDFGPTIRAIVADRRQRVATRDISAKFHNTMAAAVVQACRLVRGQRELNVVALSGGVFQNELLLRRTVEALQSHHFRVFTNTAVPPNDGGLALGQAAVAVERMKRRCV
ncbi:MAG TPA: carbamoyltransferase HypF [Verrucomicrobiae bacterium]|nr:carbamoyltransferase HypF [Verrucomicrobiae bacterium]